MKINSGYYIQQINQIVTKTEETGGEMNPEFEKIRKAIDDQALNELTKEECEQAYQTFEEGVKVYRELFRQLESLKAPVKVMGVNMKLKKAYGEYVLACEDMLEAVNLRNKEQMDSAIFDASESKQDELTDVISFCIQRITQLLMK